MFLINEKKEWIRLKKRLDFMSDLNPLTLNIEQIYTLPEKIKVAEDDGSIPVGDPDYIRKQQHREKEIEHILKGN